MQISFIGNDIHFSVSDTGILGRKEILVVLRPSDFQVGCIIDEYRRFVGVKAIKLGSCDKHPAYRPEYECRCVERFSCSWVERFILLVCRAFQLLVCRAFHFARVSSASVARVSSVSFCSCVERFSCSCVDRFILLMCRAFELLVFREFQWLVSRRLLVCQAFGQCLRVESSIYPCIERFSWSCVVRLSCSCLERSLSSCMRCCSRAPLSDCSYTEIEFCFLDCTRKVMLVSTVRVSNRF